MLPGLRFAFLGIACAQYELTRSKTSPSEYEFQSRTRNKDEKTATEMRLRIRTDTADHTLEFEAGSRSVADKLKVQSRTRFNVRDVYTYADANANGLLDEVESATATKYDLSNQWGPISCSSTAPYICNVCNTGALPANALCFEFVVTATDFEHNNRTVHPTTVKIGMDWDPSSLVLGLNDRVALVGRFRSQTTFKDRQAVKDRQDEDEQPASDGSSVRWEKRVYSPAGDSSEVKVGVFIPGGGAADGEEKDTTDGSSMSFRQLQFSFDAAAPFSWDPDIIVPTSGVLAVIPSVLGVLACLLL